MARKASENDHIFVFAEPLRFETTDYEVRLSSWEQDTKLVKLVGQSGQWKVLSL
jgi:hypothetical protein